jgi:hypothetical protein
MRVLERSDWYLGGTECSNCFTSYNPSLQRLELSMTEHDGNVLLGTLLRWGVMISPEHTQGVLVVVYLKLSSRSKHGFALKRYHLVRNLLYYPTTESVNANLVYY